MIDDQPSEAIDPRGPYSRNAIAITLAAGAALIVGVTARMLRWRRTSTRRIWRERGLGLGRAWRRPELVARPVESSIVSNAGKTWR